MGLCLSNIKKVRSFNETQQTMKLHLWWPSEPQNSIHSVFICDIPMTSCLLSVHIYNEIWIYVHCVEFKNCCNTLRWRGWKQHKWSILDNHVYYVVIWTGLFKILPFPGHRTNKVRCRILLEMPSGLLYTFIPSFIHHFKPLWIHKTVALGLSWVSVRIF